MTSQEFLNYLLTINGIGIVIDAIMSYVIELFPGWHEGLTPRGKRLLMLALSFVIPLFAAIALGDLDRESLWSALAVGFMAGGLGFSANQIVHARKL